MSRKLLTLCFIVQPPRILLGLKKRGFGAGRWNGFGGKVAPGESIESAARREVLEECGLTVGALDPCGRIDFAFEAQPEETLEVHVFRVDDFTGTPAESEEMKPQWFNVADIPYEAMWPDDRYWLPWLVDGKKFEGAFLFRGEDEILDWTLQPVRG